MKNVKRMRARLALNALRESKTWIASKKLVLETEEGDLEINKGDQVILGATKEGEVAIKDPQAIVVVADDELAAKIVDAMKNAAELDDVKFMDKPALDAALDGETVEDLVAGLVDAEEGEEVEVATVDAEDESSVEEKCQKIAENVIELTGKVLSCESLLIDETDDAPINLGDITADTVAKEDVASEEEFNQKVAEMGGSVQPGVKQIALNPAGKVVGYYDAEAGMGTIYMDAEFDTADDMAAADMAPVAALQPAEFEAGATEAQMEMVEEALKAYEESAKSAKDLFAMAESLEKAGLNESSIATVANSFVSRSLTEGVNVFDTKLGKVVATFKESVDANNYIAESGEEARFTKRFFQEAK
jgi:hypothetical protein